MWARHSSRESATGGIGRYMRCCFGLSGTKLQLFFGRRSFGAATGPIFGGGVGVPLCQPARWHSPATNAKQPRPAAGQIESISQRPPHEGMSCSQPLYSGSCCGAWIPLACRVPLGRAGCPAMVFLQPKFLFQRPRPIEATLSDK
jgi:hypothetical protein